MEEGTVSGGSEYEGHGGAYRREIDIKTRNMRIIGIYLRESKWHSVNKILKSGWYPFGNYLEPKDNVQFILPKRSPVERNLYDLYPNNPHIEVSCLVGMNGSGKSTLLDIMYRLINNFSVKVLGTRTDNKHGRHLKYASGVNADLFYELDDVIYKIECKGDEVYLYHKVGKEFTKIEIIPEDLSCFDHFFYTISNNYSLYALNDIEYEEEDNNGDKINGDWVDGLFHKNDGYLSPIVITPFRERGSIDIEKENELALQRIMAISVLSVAKASPSLIMGYKPKAIEYSIDRRYVKRVREECLSKWKHLIKEELLNAVLDEFKKVWEGYLGDRLKIHEETNKSNVLMYVSRKELILSYLAHKAFKICTIYDDYYKLFDTGHLIEKGNTIFASPETIAFFLKDWHEKIKDVVERLNNPKFDSHINLKIRQCLNFVDSFQYNEEKGTRIISDLIEGKKVETFDEAVLLLPPAFFTMDLVLEKDDGSGKEIAISRMSSGERQLLYSLSYILYHLKNIQSVKQSENSHPYHHINLVFDEAELYYHPDYQRMFVMQLIEYINRCNLDSEIIKSINVIIATHSPFVLSDILTNNTLYLEEGKPKFVANQTFGANYYDMFHYSFFFRDTALGDVSTQRIREWLQRKNSTNQNERDFDYDELQSMIGDPIILSYLLSNYKVNDVQDKNRPEQTSFFD